MTFTSALEAAYSYLAPCLRALLLVVLSRFTLQRATNLTYHADTYWKWQTAQGKRRCLLNGIIGIMGSSAAFILYFLSGRIAFDTAQLLFGFEMGTKQPIYFGLITIIFIPYAIHKHRNPA